MESCNRGKGRIYAKKEEGVPTVKEGKRGGEGVYKRTAEKRIYPAIPHQRGPLNQQ